MSSLNTGTEESLEGDNGVGLPGRKSRTESSRRIRFAVVGLGYISQAAVLPAFRHTDGLCVLTALVSSDREKLDSLGERYNVVHRYAYEQYDECLRSGNIDAVYIALPNSMHCEYAVRAAEAGIHVLCEKPMAMNTSECQMMIDSAEENRVKLMIAYRLHFEEANMQVVTDIRDGKIGDPVYFVGAFSQQVQTDNIRASASLGGGVLMDMGIYCINAARYIFRCEPVRVAAICTPVPNDALNGVDSLTGALLEFGKGRLASFVSSFAAGDASSFTVVGTKGRIRVDPAFDFQLELATEVTVDEDRSVKRYSKKDQFAPELMRFSESILDGTAPEPSGHEGLADMRIIEAILESARTETTISLPPFDRVERPEMAQVMNIPGVRMPELVNASPPSPD